MRAQLYEYEMALLANLAPQQVEEAFALVPSLEVGRIRGDGAGHQLLGPHAFLKEGRGREWMWAAVWLLANLASQKGEEAFALVPS
jgi:hypothetical protein